MTAPRLGPSEIDQAARLLREGGLVAFPTDTVYGVAALADAKFHSSKLADFKGGRTEPFSVHLPDVATALRVAGALRNIEEHAVRNLGPSGVTVIVPHGPANKGLGLRIVQHDVGSKFLALAAAPVVATSANLHGHPPLNDPAVIAQLPGLAAVLDVGPLPERPASVVVRMLRLGLEILREGELGLLDLLKLFTQRIEFVCMGNLNRSAFASELLMQMIRYYGDAIPGFLQGWAGTSSGLIGNPQAQVPMYMKHVASVYGVDMSRHKSQKFPADTRYAPIAMGPDIYEALPNAIRWQVTDPMGKPPDAYIEMAMQVREHMNSLFGRTAIIRESDTALEQKFDLLFSGRGLPQ